VKIAGHTKQKPKQKLICVDYLGLLSIGMMTVSQPEKGQYMTESSIVQEAKERTKRVKTIAKAIGAYNFTPLISRILAEVLLNLSERDARRKMEVLALFGRIANGKTR